VLGLDRQPDGAGSGGDVLEQPVQREDQAVLDVRFVGDGGDLVVGPAGPEAGLPRPEVELLELVEPQGRDDAPPVGGAPHPAVVHAHEDAVPRHADVALDRVGTDDGGLAVGGQRVLRRFGRSAAVGDDLGAGHGWQKGGRTGTRRSSLRYL
jgi:hypothetical protein